MLSRTRILPIQEVIHNTIYCNRVRCEKNHFRPIIAKNTPSRRRGIIVHPVSINAITYYEDRFTPHITIAIDFYKRIICRIEEIIVKFRDGGPLEQSNKVLIGEVSRCKSMCLRNGHVDEVC